MGGKNLAVDPVGGENGGQTKNGVHRGRENESQFGFKLRFSVLSSERERLRESLSDS